MNQVSDINPELLKARLIEEFNLGDLPQNEQDFIVSEFSSALLERVTVATLSQLDDADFARANELTDAKKWEELQALIKEKVLNANEIADEIIVEGIAEFKAMLEKDESEASDSSQGVALP